MRDDIVERRLVFHVGGYDPVPPDLAHRRFARELRRFETTWSARASIAPPLVVEDAAIWSVEASGPNWSARSEVRLVRWDDVMARERDAPAWRRLARGFAALADFVAGGALWGYLRRAWRYALFFLFPYALLAALAAIAALAGGLLAKVTGSAPLGVAAGVAALAGLVWWAGRRMMLNHLLDDWIFSSRYLRREDPILSPRLERLAGDLVAGARGGGFDEVVVIGHSLGAVLAVELVGKALQRDPELGRSGARVALVTVGSSLPKLGLHRAAGRLKAAIAAVIGSPALFWVEYQALTDAMNFYKMNPAQLIGRNEGGPIVRIVRISRMLNPSYYKRIKRDFFRVHNQFVSGNDQRALYDYFMMVCGPLPVEEQARSREGAMPRIGPDGALLSPVPAEGSPAQPPAVARR